MDLRPNINNIMQGESNMKKKMRRKYVTIAAAICSCLLLTPMSNALADKDGHGSRKGSRVTVEDTISWWQWALDIPSSVHPLSLKPESDPTGKNYCMVGQHGDVWYLGGIFKVVDPIPDTVEATSVEATEGIDPFVVVRECRIPLGQEILIPVLNVECNTAEEVALGNLDPDATLDEKADYLLNECATPLADLITVAEASFGLEGKKLKDVKVKRVATEEPFQVTFSPDNIISSEDFLLNPDPNPSLAQADGYWAKVKPKKAGTYVLKTLGVLPDYEFALDITYTIEVVVEGPGAIFD